jgi:hypothetical protein
MKALPLALCAGALLGGIVALLVWGASPPVWLAGLEAALLMGAALLYGYFGRVPDVPRWLWLRPIRGTVLVCMGIVAMYVPPQLVLAAFLVGTGVRLVWVAACDLVRQDALVGKDAEQDSAIVEKRSNPEPLAVGLGKPAARGIRRVWAGRQLGPKS